MVSTAPATASAEAPHADEQRIAYASTFSIEQLTAAYNQTRVDYLVPMPMNAARLAEYVKYYDVEVARSVVTLGEENAITGLGMLGVRPGRTWITRLGVLPSARRRGTGRAIMDALLAQAAQLNTPLTILEVIQNNTPAYKLFLACGFEVVRELLILRRAPRAPVVEPKGTAEWLEREQAFALLQERSDLPSWLTDTASLAHVYDLRALRVALPDGSNGWLVYQLQSLGGFPMLLSKFVFHTSEGIPPLVAAHLLTHLYTRYPTLDTHTENIAHNDPHVPTLFAMGFLEAFRRIEMFRHNQVT